MRRHFGFTLIEVMVVVVVIGILAAIALPSYQNYITKSRAQSAAADLGALSAAIESRFQRTLQYHPADLTGTDGVKGVFTQWSPSTENFFNFNYKAPDAVGLYSLEAVGKGAMAGCELSYTSDNGTRDATADCRLGGTW